jgi:hypothetical protein
MIYPGNRLINMNNGLTLLIVSFATVGAFVYQNVNPEDINVFLFVIPFAIVNNIRSAFYFELNDAEFIVLNYMIPFMKFSYKSAEISEIEVLAPTYRSGSKARLKIRMDHDSTMGYSASSLGIIDWRSLIEDFREREIGVSVAKPLVTKFDIRR